jgi:HlyD family secretion protein
MEKIIGMENQIAEKKKKKKRRKIIILIVVILLIISVALFFLLASKDEGYTQETAQTKDITTYYSFSGNIEAKDSQTVYSKNVLPIKKIYVKEGDIVKKGEKLFVFDNSGIASSIDQAAASLEIAKINYEKAKSSNKDAQILQAQSAVDSAQIAYDNAKTNLDNATLLYNQGTLTAQELAQAQSAYDTANTQLINAKKSLSIATESAEQNIQIAKEQLNQAQASYDNITQQADDLVVTAEISGEVNDIYAKENQTVTMGSPIMNIVNYDQLEVTVKVDEYDLAAISVGKEVSLTVSALDIEVKGTVEKVSKQATVVNGVSFFPTKIAIESNENLRVGMSTEIKILNQYAADATTISMKALQFDNENQPFIYYRDEEDKVATRKVKTGINDGTTVQILEGLSPGDIILVPQKPTFNPFDVISD